MSRIALHWQIAIAIVLAAVAGTLTGTDATVFGVTWFAAYDFLGTLFLNALKMIVVPLVMASIISGMANIGDTEKLGKLGGKTLLFYVASSLFAVLVGLVLVNLIQPGVGTDLTASIDPDKSMEEIRGDIEGTGTGDLVQIFVRMIPPNVIAAAAEGQMLGLIFFSLLFGYFLAQSNSTHSDLIRDFWLGVTEVMTMITLWVMQFAPIGVFGLVAKTVAATGFEAFQPMLVFFITVVLALAVHAFVTMPLILRYVGGITHPARHYRAMSPALLTAFSTASSAATLPLTMECIEQKAGVSQRVRGFVLPLGATVNMDGTALYECVAAIFIAQVFGIELTFVQQFTVVLVALLTSIGVAGIPAASLVAISIILTTLGLPLEGIGLLMVTDRILDMLRTSVNVFGDSCATVVIARSEGEKTKLVD